MLSTLKTLTVNARNYFTTPSWLIVLQKEVLLKEISKYVVDVDDIFNWRLACKRMNELIVHVMEESRNHCLVIDNNVEEDSVKKGFKIRYDMIRFRNVSKIEEIEKWLKRVNTSNIREVELVDCSIVWADLLRLIYYFKNMETLKIVARNEKFSSLYPVDETESEMNKLADEERFKVLREMDDVITQGLPLDILKHAKRKLRKFTIDSLFIHYSAILLKILPLKYVGIEEFYLNIGSSDEAQQDYRSAPHLFTSLSNCLAKNNLSLKKFSIDTYVSTNGIERNQRMFFNEFVRSIVPMLKAPLKSVTDVSLSFANPNFEFGETRNKLKRFLKSLTALKNIHIGPIQMKKNLELLIFTVVPHYVNCNFEGIYMFQRTPRSLVPNNVSYSDVSFTLSRLIRATNPLLMATQKYNFKNYLPENNFEKTMIHQMLPLMTTLHIDQNPQVIPEGFCIQDKEMQIIMSKGEFITSLKLRCNLTLLTDSGLTGLKPEICKRILDEFKENNAVVVQALTHLKSLRSSKVGLGVSLASLKLEHLALHDVGESVTDATAFFIAMCGMPGLKTIEVNSPKLTELGMEAIRNSHLETNIAVDWFSS